MEDIIKTKERLKQVNEVITTLTNSLAETKDRAVFEQLQDAIDLQSVLTLQIEAENAKARRLLAESNLGRRFTERTFETFDASRNTDAFEKALDYAENFLDFADQGKGLVFIGPVGTGKTHLAAAITNKIIAQYGLAVKFGGFVDLLEEIKQQFGRHATDDQALETLLSVPLLVIDDLGKERQSEWSRSILYQTINRRYEAYRPIIATSNYEPKALEKIIGDAAFSRLVEVCDFIRVDGADYRKQRLV